MTPEQFIDKWSRANRTERQAAQEHFIDLCRVLGEPTPNEADDPDTYSFEKGVSKTDGRAGFADVWKRGCFGWEYKKDRANFDLAYQQLQLYSVALENLYNQRPQWLADAHRDLDAAVAAAYGWPADISEEDALAKLLELNLARACAADPPSPSADDDAPDEESGASASPILGRKTFEKISEVEGIKLTEEMKKNAGRIRPAETAGRSAAPRDHRKIQTSG
jgi:hypothetical protein